MLERLPVVDRAAAAARALLRSRLKESPDDLEAALSLARSLVSEGRTRSDPRAFGYAQAALSRWWDQPEPPVPVLVLRATIRQAAHDFEPAQKDLERAVARDPGNAQAWLSLAVLQQVRGEPRESSRSCAPLLRLVSELVTCACLAPASALAGRGRASYDLLAGALARAGAAAVAERLWAEGLLGEIAARLGLRTEAERHFQVALAGARDPYLLGVYADLLLDAGRPGEVEPLLGAEAATSDPLLLRVVEAQKTLGRPGWPVLADTLARRFDGLRARGDRVHLREESRFALRIRGEAARALALAVENWAVVREPVDARSLFEAALAAGRPEAAQPGLAWMRGLGLEDVGLEPLAKQLEAREVGP